MLNITLTDTASAKLKELIGKNGTMESTYLRVYVAGGGCSGMSYGMALDNKVHEGDEVVEQGALKIVVDPNSKEYVDGSNVDYVESVAGSGFLLSNPNNWSTCGCGKSFTKKGEEAPDQGHHAHAHAH